MKRTLGAKLFYLLRMLFYIVVLSSVMLWALYGLPASVRYRVTEHYQFAAATEAGTVALGLLVPKSGPYQHVLSVDVVWDEDETRESASGVDVVMLAGQLAAGEIKTATIAYEVILPQGKTLWDAPVEDFQQSPQEKIESDALPITHLAAQLVSQNAATRQDVFSIYSFVAGYLAWPTGERINVSPTALDALASGVGGCEDFANLMVALCRASGAPAQTISGLYFPETLLPFVTHTATWMHPAGAHAWVEFYTEAGWEMADPSHASALLPLRARAFGRNDGRHLSYGEAAAELGVYAEMQQWALKQGEMVAAMSAPLKFVATASAADVSVTPTVTVTKVWDGVWFNFILVFVVSVVLIRLIENFFHNRQKNTTLERSNVGTFKRLNVPTAYFQGGHVADIGRLVFPFTAIVNQERMKRALVLNAINSRIGGVLIRGERGTAKSTAARALAALLPDIDVVTGDAFGCDPDQPATWCTNCREHAAQGETLPFYTRKVPFVELPIGATEDRVVGTLDIERAIQKGERRFEPGVLAAANRGILYVDEVNLLDDHIVDVLLDAAAMGVNTVEREGISFQHPARFILVGTMNPEEGDLRPQLLDRFALCVDVQGVRDARARMAIMERNLAFEQDPAGFYEEWLPQEMLLAQRIEDARCLLLDVHYTRNDMSTIAEMMAGLGVDGHRADLVILKTAVAHAAWEARAQLTDRDIMLAAELALPHRLKRKPFDEVQTSIAQLDKMVAAARDKSAEMDTEQEATPLYGDAAGEDRQKKV